MEWQSAVRLASDLRSGAVSAEDVMSEVYDRIERVNPQLNAIVSLVSRDEAMAAAREADTVPDADRGPLHGMPWAVKDAVTVRGFATAMGFAPFADRIAETDDIQAARLRAAGVIFIGRTNMPEFGLGSHTFNNLYGVTRNPWAMDRTCGGSSGGAAVALATGMLPLADGSDMGGSLRNPASFCNVVGFRPSMGRTPAAREGGWHARLSTTGPMGVTVADTAFLMAQQAGPDLRDPITLDDPGTTFLAGMEALRDLAGKRIALSPTMGGLPVDSEVESIIRNAGQTCASLGAEVELKDPPLAGAMDVFQVQRAAALAGTGRMLDEALPDWRRHAKETAVWNIEKGLALSGEELLKAEVERTRIYREMVAFFEDHDALLLPAAQVPPFPADQDYVREINGVTMATYIDWMTVCCAVTITGFPTISVPAGFTDAGLPVGLQIVGKPRDDVGLLQLAGCFEAATRCHERRPGISAWG